MDFNDDRTHTTWRNTSRNRTLVERFTRVDIDTLLYEFTVTDPDTWERPWSVELPMQRSELPIYEFACHEGNYGLENILGRQPQGGSRGGGEVMTVAARRMSRIKASPAAVISAKAMEMARDGRDVIALSAGEPDFDTPDHVKHAAVRAIGEGKTKYPPLTGIPELREAICRKLERGERSALRLRRGARLQRRQAGHLQRADRDARPRPGGRHSGSILGELSRHGAARERQPGGGPPPTPRTGSACGRSSSKQRLPRRRSG